MLGLIGCVALLILAIVLISPLRMTWLQRWGIGLRRSLRWHHGLALGFAVLATWHVLIAILPYWQFVREGMAPWIVVRRLWADPLIASGSIAYFLFALTIGSSWFSFMSRSAWLRWHRASLLGLVGLTVHLVYSWSNRLRLALLPGPILRLALLLGFALCTAALCLHYLFPHVLSRRWRFFVVKVEPVNHDVVSLILRLVPGSKGWISGSFGFFSFRCRGNCGVSSRPHPFTVVDCLGEDRIQLMIKRRGVDTLHLQAIEVGSTGVVSGPYGDLLTLRLHPEPQLWLAGGLGILPFLGLLRALRQEKQKPLDVKIIYFYSPVSGPLCLDEMLRCIHEIPGILVYPVVQAAPIKANLDLVCALIPDFKMRLVALAGPHAMVETWASVLHDIGIRNIYREDFAPW